MSHELTITPSGHLALLESPGQASAAAFPKAIVAAFAESASRGLLHLATNELQTRLPPALEYVRSFARTYLTRLCQTQAHEATNELPPTPPPSAAELATWILQAPPMTGLEYLREERSPTGGPNWTRWSATRSGSTRAARRRISARKTLSGGLSAESRCTWPRTSAIRTIPFAFLATYASRLSTQGRVQHEPLGRASQQYAGAKNRKRCWPCWCPCRTAAERSTLIKELVDSGDVYHPLAWSPREAHRFLQDIPIFEESGLIVRVPDWWKPHHPPRPIVNVQDRWPAQVQSGRRCAARFLGRRRARRRAVERGRAAGIAGLGGRPGPAQGQVGGGRSRETGRGARALADRRTQGPQRTGCPSSKGCACWRAPRSSATRRPTFPESTREWTGLTAGPDLEATLHRLKSPDAPATPQSAGIARRAAALSAQRPELAAFPDAARPRRLPGRRHGPGQDRAGDRPAARLEGRKQRTRRERRPHPACWSCRPR